MLKVSLRYVSQSRSWGLLYIRTSDELAFYSGGAEYSYSWTPDNTWTHIAMTLSASANPLMYVNGSLLTNVGDVSSTPINPSFSHIRIGGNHSGSFFGGSMVGVAVYSEVKDADFIYAQYAKGLFGDWSADSGLVGYWKMGNGTGDVYPTIVDQSSNSNNGTMTSMASDDIVENMVAGYDLGSYNTSSVATTVDYLDFTNGSVGSTSPITAFGTNPFSISTWVNASGSFQSVFMTETSASTLDDWIVTGKLNHL